MPAETVNLSGDDIQHNLKQKLSPAQISLLKQHQINAVLKAIGFTLSLIGLLTVIFLQIYLLIPLFIFWMWLLRDALPRLRAIQADLKQGKIETFHAKVYRDLSFSPGIIRLAQHRIVADDREFSVSKQTAFQLRDHERYIIHVAAQSSIFLGAILAGESETVEIIPPQEILQQFNERQLEILRLIAAGFSNREIAGQLYLSVNTIKMYASQIYEILHVNRRTEAVAKAREIGILS